MSKKQTAVQYIEEYLKYKGIIINDKTIPQVLIGVINEAKEMEKQQIIDAYYEGKEYGFKEQAEQHYTETFNN